MDAALSSAGLVVRVVLVMGRVGVMVRVVMVVVIVQVVVVMVVLREVVLLRRGGGWLSVVSKVHT